jgi:hypothetical protein
MQRKCLKVVLYGSHVNNSTVVRFNLLYQTFKHQLATSKMSAKSSAFKYWSESTELDYEQNRIVGLEEEKQKSLVGRVKQLTQLHG